MVSFLPTIAKQLGFSGILVGSIYTILPISGLVAKPLFGALADKFRLHKTFFLAFQAILAIAFFGINFIPDIETSADVVLACDGKDSFLEITLPGGVEAKLSNSTTRSGTYCEVSEIGSQLFHQTLFFSNRSTDLSALVQRFQSIVRGTLPLESGTLLRDDKYDGQT